MDALGGVKVVDLSVNAPGPFASLMLADLGAEVTCIVNPVQPAPTYAGAKDDPLLTRRGGPLDALTRGKTTRALDLKSQDGRAAFLELIQDADVMISEMRPGKLDALGLSWASLQPINSSLILCEITGYGPNAPQAARAGHDINYLAVSGALSLIRDSSGKPIPPQNFLGDYAGGCLAVSAILATLFRRERTGKGAHIDLSMTDGVRYLISDIAAATLLAGHPSESWRATLSGGMPTYDVYATADGQWMAVGALEPKFIAILGNALDWPELPVLVETQSSWEEARLGLEQRFRTRTRDEWAALFDPLDACVSPVLTLDELPPGRLPDARLVFGEEA